MTEKIVEERKKPKIRTVGGGMVDEELTKIAEGISEKVIKDFNLSYPDINFHMIDLDELASVIAAGGWAAFPQHWSLGQSYQIQKQGHQLGLWRVYEIVVDSGSTKGKREPVDAYIYTGNQLVDTKLVMAHVYGHAHVFENNWRLKKNKLESPTAVLSDYRERIEKIEQEVGEEKVEEIMDISNSLYNLIDVYPEKEAEEKKCPEESKLLTPEEKKKKLLEKIENRGEKEPLPEERDYDVFKFIYENSELLADWEKEILEMEYNMARLFEPIGTTKILNEGFAALVDYRYGIEGGLPIGEAYDYLKHRTASLFMKETEEEDEKEKKHRQLDVNPYAMGFAILTYIINKWGSGKVGFEHENEKYALSRIPDKIDMERGWDKVLEVVATNTDYTLIDTYFTQELYNIMGKNLFTYSGRTWDPQDWYVDSREFKDVKNALLFMTYNGGNPRICVEKGGGNYNNKGELYLVHDISGFDKLGIPPENLTLDPEEMTETLKEIYGVWRRPVHLETIDEGGRAIIATCADGKELTTKRKDGKEDEEGDEYYGRLPRGT